jgi:hypothetical protein
MKFNTNIVLNSFTIAHRAQFDDIDAIKAIIDFMRITGGPWLTRILLAHMGT